MPKVNAEVLKAVQAAFQRYESEVLDANLKDTSKDTYINRARYFVRWLDDDFDPGSNLRN